MEIEMIALEKLFGLMNRLRFRMGTNRTSRLALTLVAAMFFSVPALYAAESEVTTQSIPADELKERTFTSATVLFVTESTDRGFQVFTLR
jgi:hypothetical protein